MADVLDVACGFLDRCGPMSALKLEMLVYYGQAWHLAINGTPLFEDTVQAGKQGPVVEGLRRPLGALRLISSWPRDTRARLLSDSESGVLQAVCAAYGDMDGDQLSSMARADDPWRRARGRHSPHTQSRVVIPHRVMANYYRHSATPIGLVRGSGLGQAVRSA
jgi:uncharacterized phage-associated protein